MQLLTAMGPPGGGRMVISTRLQSRFNLINMTFPSVSISCISYMLFAEKGNYKYLNFDVNHGKFKYTSFHWSFIFRWD